MLQLVDLLIDDGAKRRRVERLVRDDDVDAVDELRGEAATDGSERAARKTIRRNARSPARVGIA